MIDHRSLLNKLQTFPKMRTIIKQWLKAGIIDKNVFQKTNTGTQQGSVVSPVLANIALHGLETAIISNTSKWAIIDDRKVSWTPKVICYADDFVVLHRDLRVLEQLKQRVSDWLADMGLSLKPEKTQITHTLQGPSGAKPGFDFLGFTIRQYPVGKYNGAPKQIIFKTLIKPSKKGVQRHLERLREIIDNHKSDGQGKLINTLNPIRGWCNYYSTVVSKQTFSKANYATFQMLWA
ncbi:Group II intron, maturase-specific domain [Sporomusa malonica]|uniref:Group II intron, maturase-specific domain n=2 Tax=Sporomusa malonica TaxID=112901 RepID=A0A1W2BAQ6_9FIRM|nr:Group II intron, maturase-specific domain [Sporomusa malonica]